MSRWGNRNQEDQGLNFGVVFQQHPDALEILQLNNILEEVKSKSTKFTQKLVQLKHRDILYQFFEIAISPQNFMAKRNKSINKKITHGAIEILTNLSQQFIEAIFETEQTKEDQVVQNEREYPILTFLFKILTESLIQETGLAYFSKIITPFIYQKPQEMLKVLTNQIDKTIVPYFWSPSISEIISKVLEAQSEKDFFQQQKLEFIKKICKAIVDVQGDDKVELAIESFGGLIEALLQKHEDKYEKAKYAGLLRNIVKEVQCFSFLISHLQKYSQNRVIKTQLLHCIENYLRIHLPPKVNSKLFDQQNQPEPLILKEEIVLIFKNYFSSHSVNEFVSDIRLELLYYYKVLKIILVLFPQFTDNIVTKNFLGQTLKLMRQDVNNNILHNFQKDIIVAGVKESANVFHIVQSEIGLEEAIRSTISDKNTVTSYANQLFFMAQAIRLKSQQAKITVPSWSDLQQKIANKRKFYEFKIGGNLKGSQDGQKWDKFQNDLILRPLAQKQPEKKQESPKREKDQSRGHLMLVSRLDDIEGTEVLSEEQQDPFNQKEGTKNSHYYDDLGLPQLPLDSDKSQDQNKNSNSLDDLPATIRQNSGIFIPLDDFPQTINQDSYRQHKVISIEEDGLNDLPDTLGCDSNKDIKSKKLEKQNSLIIINTFDHNQPEPLTPDTNAMEIDHCELTVSINIEEQIIVKQVVPCKEQIEQLLLLKYNLCLQKNISK